MSLNIRTLELPNHVTLPYVEQGDASGLPVALLHGFADSWRSFEPVLPHLPESIHVFALTQRGHGEASRPLGGYGIHDFAADLLAFMDALHLGPAVIVGHSMGSAVALRFAIDHPERTLGLVVVGASASMSGTQAAREFWDSTVSKVTDPVDPGLVRGMTESLLAKPVPPDVLEMAVAEGRKVPAHVWKAVFQSRWRLEGDFSGELDQIKVPTLIVWGDQDRRYPRSEQDALASAIGDSQLLIYPGAGHLLHWEEPGRFASDLVAFVEDRLS
ncbi:MAG: alpha/beta fold hydrolase [Actinomycetota bacterium]